MPARLRRRFHLALEKRLPEQRLFLHNDDGTRFLRLKSPTQAMILFCGAGFVLWSTFATAMALIGTLGTVSHDTQLSQERAQYEERLNKLAAERDRLAGELRHAQDRFDVALRQVSAQQTLLLKSEDRRREQEAGLMAVRGALATAVRARDAAQRRGEVLLAESASGDAPMRDEELRRTLDFMSLALADTAVERDGLGESSTALKARIAELELAARLDRERNERIFKRLEEAVSVSIEPLEKVFRNVGIPADKIISDVRRGYTGAGGPFNPVTASSKGAPVDPVTERFNGLMRELDRINLYRMALDRVPLATPVQGKTRFTSGFGGRRHPVSGQGDFHEGLDMAGPSGTPVVATADGVVTYAGWQGAYGRLVKIRHADGLETRYAHLRRIHVEAGQKVSRGDRIGDMGSSGRSTGTHLHYEVRRNGKALNPMTYIKAARDVF